MTKNIINPGQILTGSLFNEPMRVETVRANGPDTWIVGLVGTQSERFRSVTFTSRDIEALTILDVTSTYDGDGRLLRLGLQAYSLGIAYEFDPYFGLSISRVDPLPHQLEAIYDYLLKLPRVRFLLADDAGAGKTITAGLLIRELKLRGLADRTLIVCPANLTFQWQRELNEKFDEKFKVLKGGEIRDQFGINQWLEQKQVVHERLFVVELRANGEARLQEPSILGNFLPAVAASSAKAGSPTHLPENLPSIASLPEATAWLNENGLMPFLEEVRTERLSEIDRIAAHVELSLTELLQKADEEIGRLASEVERKAPGAEGRLTQAESRHSELLDRRERRRLDWDRQRALSLQSVERITSVLILPHPERKSPEVRRLQPDSEVEATAMQVAMEYEKEKGRQVHDVHEKNFGYDLTSLDLNSGELRLIEVKGIGESAGNVLLTPNEKRVAEERRDCYWLYVVTDCKNEPQLQNPIKDPARLQWHEVKKVDHYYLSIDAVTQPMQVREEIIPYGDREK